MYLKSFLHFFHQKWVFDAFSIRFKEKAGGAACKLQRQGEKIIFSIMDETFRHFSSFNFFLFKINFSFALSKTLGWENLLMHFLERDQKLTLRCEAFSFLSNYIWIFALKSWGNRLPHSTITFNSSTKQRKAGNQYYSKSFLHASFFTQSNFLSHSIIVFFLLLLRIEKKAPLLTTTTLLGMVMVEVY